MLKVSVRAGGQDMIMASGNLAEMLTDLSITIKAIYEQMKNMNPVAAEAFKAALKMGVAMEDSPVWGAAAATIVGMGFSVPGDKKGGGE